MSIIIIEGIDRVGKTTLALQIKKELNAKIFKDKTVDDMMSNKELITEKILTTVNMLTLWPKDDIIVIDRFHLSELVYGYIERNYVNGYMKKIDDMLLELDAKLILVEPTDLKWSSEKHGKDLSKHKELFDYEYSISKLKKFKCNHETINNAITWLEGVL